MDTSSEELSSTGRKLSFDTLMEEVKPTVAEKNIESMDKSVSKHM